MRYSLQKLIAIKFLLLFFLTSTGAMAQNTSPRLSASAALGIPATLFGVNSKFMGIYTGAARYSFNKTWSFETKLTAHTFFNNATGNGKKTSLDGDASDVLTFRTPTYGLNGIVYYNLHNILGLDKMPDARWLPFVNLGIGMYWYKPTVSFADGSGSSASSFGAPYRDYQLGAGTRYYLNHLIDLYAGAEYHFAQTYYLDGIKEKNNPSLDTYLNFYAGLSVKLGAKKHANLIDWAHKNIEKESDDPKDYSKWAIDGSVGLPILLSPVAYRVTGMFGLGLRHSFNNFLSGQFNFLYGNVAGNQATTGTPMVGSSEYVREFSTNLSQITGRMLINIRSMIAEPSNRTMWNHYAVIGAGYTKATGDATFADNKSVKDAKLSLSPGIQTIIIGYQARKYINAHFDLIAGIDFNYNGSKYLDQAYANTSIDNHLYLNTGVTYKIGTSKDREHIDWAYQNYNNYKNRKTVLEQVPVIEKPVTEEPKIEVIPVAVETAPASEGSATDSVMPVSQVAAPAQDKTVPSAPAPELKPSPINENVSVPEPSSVPVKTTVQAPATSPAPVSSAKKYEAKIRNSSSLSQTNNKPKAYIATYDVVPPPYKYNVIVGCYSVNKLSIAKNTQDQLALKGYSPSIYRSSTNSRMLRLAVISTDDKADAIRVLRKARKEIDPGSWIYLYNAQ
jgi:hypothetical protein